MGDKQGMGCTKAQLNMLLDYIENECANGGTLDNCLKVISLVKARISELAINEVLSELFR